MTVSINARIAAPLDDVWAMVSDFGSLERWHPLVERCEIEGSGEGAVRTIHFAGSWAVERLERLDQQHHSLHYAIIDGSDTSPIGLNGHISLVPGPPARRS